MPTIIVDPKKGLHQKAATTASPAGTLSGDRKVIKAKTSDYTVVEATDLSGTIFTTSGSSASVAFTLYTPSSTNKGVYYEFFNQVNQNMTISGSTANTLVLHNDVDADALGFTASGEKIGAAVKCVSDGTVWLVFPMTEETTTMDVKT